MRVEVTVRQDGMLKTRYLNLAGFSIPLRELQELLAVFFEEVVVNPVAMRATEV
jgi:hypothetical protein